MIQKEIVAVDKSHKLLGIDPQNLISLEMGNADIALVCTYGKITFICNSNVSDYTIGLILKKISLIDNSTTHETDLFCDFDDIQKYQTMEYMLVTYGRHEKQYRATFNIIFSSDKALYNLTVAFFNEVKKEHSLKKDFYWNGKDSDIVQLYKELKDLPNWTIKSIKNKDKDAAV
jgi:hypothetical protein